VTVQPASPAVGFEELRWLAELNYAKRKGQMPELIGAKLVKRGLIERMGDGYVLTARGRIALAKLG
jgi:hypothetical protein